MLKQEIGEETLRLALAGGNPIMRAGIRTVLAAETSLQLKLESPELDEESRELDGIDVVLFGLDPPVELGLERLRRLNERHPDLATVVFTLSEREPCFVEAILAGARGFLLKDYSRDDILDAVRAAGRGKNVQVPADLLYRVIQGLPWFQEGNETNGGFQARLTNRELEILQLMATGAAYRTIAEQLFLAESTVKKYAHSVISKLGVSNRSTAVITAYRLNILQDREGS